MPIPANRYDGNATDTLIFDTLARLVLIQQLIPRPGNTGLFVEAGSQFWDPQSGPFPRFFNRWAGFNTDMSAPKGQPLYQDTHLFEMRLVVGSLATGYLGVTEDEFNQLVYATINCFRERINLNSPVDGTPFRYLAPGRNASQIIQSPNGLHGFTFDNNPGSPVYLGGSFMLSVNVLTQVGRIS